ncbi:flagellar brake protein [Bordetella hinzii]|uniref:Flagellar brake protein YcgR n=2 Tax=Bordetella hinzii TaxID=103855 RepID=A0AAN1RYM1_9BORD|nr:flagellar brake protein [Bordetella hinzii]AKQ56702.1 Flagellar brake protein YcgR [Bordetella hinzii]AKQ61160.1 Flagellar brake protein YcgR [Bordetella hinzii]AZW17843.1 flagellar brake protein [Bordetella hinzii]KCB22072.1 flagellar regulator YcgR [Bordetella hinzii OH87 BAL007II]KCB30902.1 flagellar regulator YcgR [Bordetella hinzii L60]
MDHEDYLVTGRLEIVHLLLTIMQRQSLVFMHVPGRPINSVTSLLAVDADRGEILLDAAQESSVNERIAAGERVSFETSLDNIRVSFSGSEIAPVQFDGRPALRMPLPSAISRMQRRDSFRIEVPVLKPATWSMAGRRLTLPVKDISSTGLALNDVEQQMDTTPGAEYDGVLSLPEIGAFALTVRVVHHADQDAGKGKILRRIGCTFVDLENSIRIRIQSYVNTLQRAMIARQRGN